MLLEVKKKSLNTFEMMISFLGSWTCTSRIQAVFRIIRLLFPPAPYLTLICIPGWPYYLRQGARGWKRPSFKRGIGCLLAWIRDLYKQVSRSCSGLKRRMLLLIDRILWCVHFLQMLQEIGVSATVADARFCKPLDTALIRQLAKVCVQNSLLSSLDLM